MRLKVYNKQVETFMSCGSHSAVGTGFYNHLYKSDGKKIILVENDGWTRVEATYYFHTNQESESFLRVENATKIEANFKKTSKALMDVLTKHHCIRKVSFEEFLRRLFKNNGL